jgi:hypothetical protein
MTQATQALVVDPGPGPGIAAYAVPDATAVAMIRRCYAQLAQVRDLPQITKVIAAAAAIDAVTQQLKASEGVRKMALLLRLEAEQQLGRITQAAPQRPRGRSRAGPIRAGHAAPACGPTRGKREFLADHGINKTRVYAAEKLATLPRAALVAAVEAVPAPSFSGVKRALGVLAPVAPFGKEKAFRDVGFLAQEAIALLAACVQAGTVPHAGTVREMGTRWRALSARPG